MRDIPVIVYRPHASDRPLPVFVYLHGGGFRVGDEWSNDRQMRELAQAWGGVVISADYLHVPEHVFPLAVEETAALLTWLHLNGGSWGISTERIALGGTSAGAVVAFGAAVVLGGPPWLGAAVAVAGAFGADPNSQSMRNYGDVGLFPSAAEVAPMFTEYLPRESDWDDPRANLLLADASLMPPTFLAAAEYDVFGTRPLLLPNEWRKPVGCTPTKFTRACPTCSSASAVPSSVRPIAWAILQHSSASGYQSKATHTLGDCLFAR